MNRILALLLGLLVAGQAAADISFVAQSNASGGSETQVTPAEPTGTQQNDVVLAACVKDNGVGAITDPADFTQIDSFIVSGAGPAAVVYLGYKPRGANAGSGYQFSHDQAADAFGCSLFTFRGVNTSAVLDVAWVKATHYNESAAELTAPQPITTVRDGAEFFVFYHEQSDVSVTSGPPATFISRGHNISGGRQIVGVSKNVATAGTETPGVWTFPDLATSAVMVQMSIALRPAPPTFTAGPTAGTITESSIAFSFTSSLTGTVKGVACPNGQANPTVAQVFAGNCTGDVAAEATISEAVTAAVGGNASFTGLDASTTYDTHFAIDGNVNSDAISSVPDQTTDAGSAAPAFSAGPTVVAATNGFTIGGTVDANATVYAVACNPGDAAPSASELKAGDCGGGNDAVIAANEAWTASAADTFALASANKPVKFNVYVLASNGDGDSEVSPFTGRSRSPRSGFLHTTIASISATGVCDFDADYDPDCAVGDVFEYQDEADENADCAVLIGTDGDVEYTPAVAGDCDGRLTVPYSAQDVSNATNGLFTAPAGMFTTDDEIVTGNSAPTCTGPESPTILLLEDEEKEPTDLAELGGCEDLDLDQLTATITDGTLPNGTTQEGTGDLSWEGTPDTEDEGGEDIEVTMCDIYDECDTFTFTVYTVNTWTVPDLDGMDASEAAAAIVLAAPWREADVGLSIGSLVCDAGISGETLAQDPAASAEAEAFDPITISLSRKCGGRRPFHDFTPTLTPP